MIRRANSAKLVALSVALVLHSALAVALVARETTEIEGADGGTEVRLGNAFADMAAGTISSASAQNTEITAPAKPEKLDAQRAEPREPENVMATVEHAPSDIAQPVEAEHVPSKPIVAAAQMVPAQTSVPAQHAEEALQPPPVLDRIAAKAPESSAVAWSLRPKLRSTKFESTHKPAQVAKPKSQKMAKPVTRTKPASGNAARSARAGAATGKREAAAQHSGTAGRQKAAGNAAASNYPGRIMRKLSRAGKPRMNVRGTAVVAFSIATNGGLSSVSLARSSGSAALDKAALRLVRKASPFPKPPTGARRSFSIQIKGR